MFLRQTRIYSHLLFTADMAAGFAALYFSYYLRYYLVRWAPLEISRFFNPELLPFREYFFFFLLFLPFWSVMLLVTQSYGRALQFPMPLQLIRILQFQLGVGVVMGFSVFVLKLIVSRPVFFSFLLLTGLFLLLNRVLLQIVFRSRNLNEHNQIKILIVGTDERAGRVAELLHSSRRWGFHVIGHVQVSEDGVPDDSVSVLGRLRDLPGLLQDGLVVDEVIFAGSTRRDLEEMGEVIRFCEDVGIRTRVAADFFPTSISRVSLEFLGNLPLITFSSVPDHHVGIAAKRVVDFVTAVLLLGVLSPVMLVVALLIRLTSPGPVFYSQTRCGLYGRRFRLVKFRTMIDGAEDRLWEIRHLNEMDGPVFKMRNDPRVTPLGRFLRKFSIDELPQLWNVIKGEMSIVGPRAPLPEEVRYYALKQRRRLSVKPGITCLWQVSGRNDVDFKQWMDLDLKYIDNWSFWLDLTIMARTIPAVFTGRGAR